MRVALEQEDRLRIRWMLGAIIAEIALWSLLPLEVGVRALALGAMGLIGLFTVFPVLSGILPSRFWKLMTPAIILVVLVDFFLSRGDILPPLVRMVVMLMTLRALEPRTAREDYQLIVLALFTVVISGVLSLELSFLVQSLSLAPLAMIQLFLINLSDPSRVERPAEVELWRRFGWGAFMMRLVRALDLRLALFGSVLFAIVSLFSTILFYSLPRFEFGQSLSFLRFQAQNSLSGFSDSVSFGDVVSILEDDSVALRVDVPEGLNLDPEVIYWRMLMLDEYTSDGFRISSSALDLAQTVDSHRLRVASDFRGSDAGDWTFFFEGGISRYLPLAGGFRELRFQNRQDFSFAGATRIVVLREVQANKLVYRLDGVEPGPVLHALSADEPLIAHDGRQPGGSGYPWTTLALPDDAPSAAVFADAVAGIGGDPGADPGGFVASAIDFLRRDRGYSLNVRIPRGEGGVLARWMDAGIPGHCELYAGSLVMLCRFAGIPARMVVGYSGADWNGFENYLMVRNRHAHAWVEWFDPTRGWVRADPTPGADNSAATAQSDGFRNSTGGGDADLSVAAYIDSLRMLWYRRVVNFDRAQQREMARSAQDLAAVFLSDIRDRFVALGSSARDLLSGNWNRETRELIYFLTLLAALGIVLRQLWCFRRRRDAARGIRLHPLRQRAARMLRHLRADVQAGRMVDGGELQALQASLRAVRFGHPSGLRGAAAELRGARAAYRRLRRRTPEINGRKDP